MPIVSNAQLLQDASRSTSVIVRDPARQASTEIDAVINNPAGTAFLNDGWHISLNGLLSVGSLDLSFRDNIVNKSYRNVIPSLQVAYKKNRFTYSFSFANEGGYGEWNISKDPMLSHFLSTAGNNVFNIFKDGMSQITSSCNKNDKLFYEVTNYGDNYNYSGRLGASYKINDHWSVYAGVRLNYVTDHTRYAVFQGVENNNLNVLSFNDYFTNVGEGFFETISNATLVSMVAAYLAADAGMDVSDLIDNTDELLKLAGEVSAEIELLAQTPDYYSSSYKRMNGWGISPVLGIDYKTGKFNFAANYEFETKIHTNSGYSSFHIPGKLSLGASWQIQDNLKIALGGSWSYVNVSKSLGASQSVDIDTDLILNTQKEGNIGHSDYNTTGTDAMFDISASVSFSPIKHLILSAGYTYAQQGGLFKSSYPISIYSPGNNAIDIISGGVCYEISDKAKINIGISKKYQLGNNWNLGRNWNVNNHQNLTVSAGIDFNF